MAIITVGTITFDARGHEGSNTPNQLFDVVLSGGGFNAMTGAALDGSFVHAVTTLSRSDGIHGNIRSHLQSMGITVWSQDDGNPPVSWYTTPDAIKRKTPDRPQTRDPENFLFNPNAIFGIENLTADAAVFVGGVTTSKLTRDNALYYANRLSEKGIPVIVNHNYRNLQKKPDPLVLERWAQAAQVVTFAKIDIRPLFGSRISFHNAAQQILEWGKEYERGTRLVIVTSDEKGCVAFWNEGKKSEKLRIPVPDKLDVEYPDGAGDAFAAGNAKGCGKIGMTSRSIGQSLSRVSVRQIMETGQHDAGLLLRAKNMPEQNRLPIMRPIFTGKTWPEIIKLAGYSHPHSFPLKFPIFGL